MMNSFKPEQIAHWIVKFDSLRAFSRNEISMTNAISRIQITEVHSTLHLISQGTLLGGRVVTS
jgi:hypothetical protein